MELQYLISNPYRTGLTDFEKIFGTLELCDERQAKNSISENDLEVSYYFGILDKIKIYVYRQPNKFIFQKGKVNLFDTWLNKYHTGKASNGIIYYSFWRGNEQIPATEEIRVELMDVVENRYNFKLK